MKPTIDQIAAPPFDTRNQPARIGRMAGRMKGDREHRVPLSLAAVDLLKSLYVEDGNPYLFIGAPQERLSNAAMIQTLRRLGRSETVLGLRSSFSDWAPSPRRFPITQSN
jgi:integrase